MMQESIDRHIIVTLVLIGAALLVFELSNIDIWVQNHFYDFVTHTWLIDKHQPLLRFLFYDGIKMLLLIVGGVLLIAFVFIKTIQPLQEYKKELLLVLLAAVFVPASVGSLKALTNMPCPCDLQMYQGGYPNVGLFENYPNEFVQKSKIKCWPAGHASGGFALMAFYFFFKSRKNRNRALVVALGIGWSMGGYKMLIGDHFLSHTVFTMLFAWLIIVILAKCFRINPLLAEIG
ncbi:MAG: phosphatase PAP2 family protein [Sulfurimonadaceae bacterium]